MSGLTRGWRPRERASSTNVEDVGEEERGDASPHQAGRGVSRGQLSGLAEADHEERGDVQADDEAPADLRVEPKHQDKFGKQQGHRQDPVPIPVGLVERNLALDKSDGRRVRGEGLGSRVEDPEIVVAGDEDHQRGQRQHQLVALRDLIVHQDEEDE